MFCFIRYFICQSTGNGSHINYWSKPNFTGKKLGTQKNYLDEIMMSKNTW